MLDKSGNGNHAISYNATTARPVLSARVNLLTYSEEFSNVAWTKIASNEVLSPDANAPGVMFALNSANDSLSSSNRYIGQTVAISQNTQYQFSFYAKPGANTTIRFLTRNDDATRGADFSLVGAGSVTGTYGSGVGAITNVGFGIYLCTVTWTSGTDTSILPSINCAPNTFGDGSAMFYVSAPDFRPTNIGTSVPAYQRIADQYTYDSNGFPRYLKFDGVDDGMYTPVNFNLSSTAQATVFAGVRKLSDASVAVVAETSIASSTNNGTLGIFAPQQLAANYGVRARGNADNLRQYLTYTAPITNVLSAQLTTLAVDSAASQSVRINAVSVAGADVNTGNSTDNFGTYPLYIGSRNNASLWFNGYLYSAIVVGSSLTAAQISSTEQWIAGKEGVQL